MNRFFSLILFVIFCGLQINAQIGPCLKIQEEPGCPANAMNPVTTGFTVNLSHTDITSGLSNQDSARYKAFWIFGDGNFAHFNDGERDADIATLATTYTYLKNGEFHPRSVLVEKKSDREPPKKNVRVISILDANENSKASGKTTTNPTGVTAQPATASGSFVPRIAVNHKADILNSSKIRLGGYETAFAVSTAIPTSGNNVVLFCYNSLMDTIPDGFRQGKLFNSSEIELANYTSSAGRSASTNTLPNELQFALRPYQDVIAQPLLINQNKPASFTEFRFFPVIKTPIKDPSTGKFPPIGRPILDRTGKGIAQFVAIVLENAQVLDTSTNNQNQLIRTFENGAQGSTISTAQRDTILSLISRFLPNLLNENRLNTITLQLSNGMYIRGVYRIAVPVVSVIDPTELKVLQICKEGEKYRANMKLTICNEGNAMESLVEVSLKKSNGMPYEEITYTNDTITGFEPVPGDGFSFKYKNLRGGYDENFVYQESCVDVYFNFKTDWSGVQLLQQGKGLTAEVTFTSAAVDPVQLFPNQSLSPSKVSKEYGYECGSTKDCTWLYVLLFVLTLLVWWFWKKKEDDSNS